MIDHDKIQHLIKNFYATVGELALDAPDGAPVAATLLGTFEDQL